MVGVVGIRRVRGVTRRKEVLCLLTLKNRIHKRGIGVRCGSVIGEFLSVSRITIPNGTRKLRRNTTERNIVEKSGRTSLASRHLTRA